MTTGYLLFACILGGQIHTATWIQELNLDSVVKLAAGLPGLAVCHKNLTGHGRKFFMMILMAIEYAINIFY